MIEAITQSEASLTGFLRKRLHLAALRDGGKIHKQLPEGCDCYHCVKEIVHADICSSGPLPRRFLPT